MNDEDVLKIPARAYIFFVGLEGIKNTYEQGKEVLLADFILSENISPNVIIAIPPSAEIEAGYFITIPISSKKSVQGEYFSSKADAKQRLNALFQKGKTPTIYKAFKDSGTGTENLLRIFSDRRNQELEELVNISLSRDTL